MIVNAKINNHDVEVREGTTILEAAHRLHITIPTLCKHQDLPATAACGICIVKVRNTGRMLRACSTPLENGMDIITHDAELQSIRRTVLELILSNHPDDCLQCGRNGNCELQKLAADFGIREMPFPKFLRDIPKDESTKSLTMDPQKCILCGRCVKIGRAHV